jgi:hypothetical protein
VGSWCIMGARGTCWGVVDGKRGVRWGWWGSSVEQTTRFDECVGTYAHNAVFWAVDGVGAVFTAGGWVSVVSGAVCMLDGALDAVSEAVAAGNVGVGGHNVATSMGALGCVNGVWGVSWGRWGGFVEYTTRSEEHIRTTSHTGIFWAVNGAGASFTAR